MLSLLIAASLAAATPATLPVEPAEHAEPAMFVVRDADTTIYLFGTFHALDGKADWFTDEVKSAFDQSSELVLETLVPENPSKVLVRPAIQPLPVTTSASFLGTTRLAIDAGKTQGMNVANGADMVLRRAAEMDGKDIEGLETLESQLTMFTKMPSAPARPLRAGEPVDDGHAAMNQLSHAMSDMQLAWKHGDQRVFVSMLSQLERASPDTYRMLFVERNARWADWVAARLQTPGTVFVAVGAGHLAGKDSVLVRLAQRGIESARLN